MIDAQQSGNIPNLAPRESMSTEIVGQVFESYQITALAGKGGMGAVYKARDLRLDRDVAIKVMDPHLAGDEAFMKRFRVEAKALAHLNNTHIVKIHTLEESKLGVCIVMEFVEGKTLAEIIKNSGPLDPARAIHLFDQVLAAFEHAHKAGVVHRDVKPGNIMVTAEDEAKVTDFGLAKVSQSSGATMTQLAGGTLYYMPPEQVEGGTQVDHRGDLYSIGMTLFEALTGAVPFDDTASDYAIRKTIVEGKIRPPRDINPRIPRKLNEFVIKSIAKDPGRRFQTATDMKAALRSIDLGGSLPVPPASKKGRMVLVASVGVIALAAGVYFLYPRVFVRQGLLTITTYPTGAQIILNDKIIGPTPLQAYGVSPGKAIVHVENGGFIPIDTQIVVHSGESTLLALQLKRIAAQAAPSADRDLGKVNVEAPPPRNEEPLATPPEVTTGKKNIANRGNGTSQRHQQNEKAIAHNALSVKAEQPKDQGGTVEPAENDAARKEAERRMAESLESARRERDAAAAAERIRIGLQGLTDQYKRGLENRDVSSLAALLQWSGREQDAWSKFFELSQDVKVSIEQLTHQTLQSSEQVSFQAKISYFNSTKGKEETKVLPNSWQCENVSGSWKIVARK